MRGGRRGGLWSEEEIASSGTGSERAHGRERSRGDPSASQEPREPSLAAGRTTALPGTGDPRRCGGFLGLGGDTPFPHPGDESGMSPVNWVERNRERAGEGRERSGEEAAREHLAPGGMHR